MRRNIVPVERAVPPAASDGRNNEISGPPKKKKAAAKGIATRNASFRPARKPSETLSGFLPPIFWAVKLERPLARVVKDVMVKVFNLIAA